MIAGRVVRIRSSAGGYGNCVYLLGEDGRLYVHAHLERLAPRIAARLPRPAHPLGGDYEEKTMEVFPSDPPAIAQDEILGWSGESGAGKPHLHFEVRRGDRPLNLFREGILPAPRGTRVELPRLAVEPAAPGGAIRLLAEAVERTPNGDRMAPHELRAQIRDAAGRVVARREIRFDAFDYGPDRDHGFAYDLARSGYRPTTYTFDLTGPTGGAGVIVAGGPLDLPPGEYEAEVVAAGIGGGTARRTLSFTTPLPLSGARVNRAGLLISGISVRRAFPAAPAPLASPTGDGWWARVAPGGLARTSAMDASGARMSLPAEGAAPLADGLGVVATPDPALEPPAEARGGDEPAPVAIRFEPDGLFFARPARVEIRSDASDTRAALYRRDARTGDWIWEGRERNGTWYATATRRLGAFAVWIDREAPRFVRGERRGGRLRLYFRDGLSGLESAEVRDASGRRVPGRLDPDYDAFVSDGPTPRTRASARAARVTTRVAWIVRDRAGNERRGFYDR